MIAAVSWALALCLSLFRSFVCQPSASHSLVIFTLHPQSSLAGRRSWGTEAVWNLWWAQDSNSGSLKTRHQRKEKKTKQKLLRVQWCGWELREVCGHESRESVTMCASVWGSGRLSLLSGCVALDLQVIRVGLEWWTGRDRHKIFTPLRQRWL